jgi:hypothetical protein
VDGCSAAARFFPVLIEQQMAHRGKNYPYLNRFRVIAANQAWPDWFSTEMEYLVGGWGTAGASSCNLSGRGLLPVAHTWGERFIGWRTTVGSYADLPIDLQIGLGLDPGGTTNFYQSACFWGGLKIGESLEFPCPVTTPGGPALNAGVVPNGADGGLVLSGPVDCFFFQVRWSAAPQPPLSTPF